MNQDDATNQDDETFEYKRQLNTYQDWNPDGDANTYNKDAQEHNGGYEPK